jgi:glycosyltransferase involved in cell wall biosynthesis
MEQTRVAEPGAAEETPGPAPSVSVVVPVFRSADQLVELHRRLVSALGELTDDFEIIMVEDGGGDGSWEVVTGLVKRDARVHGIQLSRNFGQHNAILCGIRAAAKDVIVTIDDDLQHPPEEIGRLLAKLDDDCDVVYGTPQTGGHGFWRDWASRITKIALANLMGAEVARNVSAFRAFRTPVRDAFAAYAGPFVSIDVLLAWGTSRFGTVPVREDPRPGGGSNYTFFRLVKHALNMITGFSVLPLQLASWTGFFFFLFGIGVLVYVLAAYFSETHQVPGFAFLASVIAILGGAQLFALGIIGEYLARMHFRLMDKPPYAIRSQVG